MQKRNAKAIRFDFAERIKYIIGVESREHYFSLAADRKIRERTYNIIYNVYYAL